MSQETNRRMGDYEILGELGSGGMGSVYRVRNVLSDRIEAMKVLLPDLAGRQELAARFLREIKVLASLEPSQHRPAAHRRDHRQSTGHDHGVGRGHHPGGTHRARPHRAIGDALNYTDQVLNALSYAHQQHVIHRDIKPANMMLTPQGVVKLMDFGIARTEADAGLTMTGATLGSLSYMSPEQTMGQGADARSDLYSVGISLYEMVTGQRPFQGDSDFSIMAAQVKEAAAGRPSSCSLDCQPLSTKSSSWPWQRIPDNDFSPPTLSAMLCTMFAAPPQFLCTAALCWRRRYRRRFATPQLHRRHPCRLQ